MDSKQNICWNEYSVTLRRRNTLITSRLPTTLVIESSHLLDEERAEALIPHPGFLHGRHKPLPFVGSTVFVQLRHRQLPGSCLDTLRDCAALLPEAIRRRRQVAIRRERGGVYTVYVQQ